MRSLLVLLVLLTLTLGCSHEAPAAPGPAPGKIVAGQGIEEVKLGASRQEVEKKLGAPQEVDRNEFRPSDTYALYYRQGIELTYSNDKVAMITLHARHDQWEAYQGSTEQGLWVGSGASEIEKALGPPPQPTPPVMSYPKLGLTFRLGQNQRVEYLSLSAPQSK